MLILHSFGRDFAPDGEMVNRFRSELSRSSPRPLEFTDASLEMARFDGGDRDGPLLDFLMATFVARPPDLIVPVSAQAMMFCRRHRATLFPKTPILLLDADKRRAEEMRGDPNLVSVGVDVDLRKAVENILTVCPDTKRIYVANGASPLEKFWVGEMKREWGTLFPNRVEFHWLNEQPLAQMQATVRKLPPDSAVLVGILMRDASGAPMMGESGLIAIHEASNAPVFAFHDQQLGLGIVGGPLVPQKKVAAAAAQVAIKLLAGTEPASIPWIHLPFDPPAYDWRELKRWDIEKSDLPPGSTVLFRQPGLWEAHQTAVLIAIAVVLFQSLLIALVLAARRRAREKEADLSMAAEAANIGLWTREAGSDEFKGTIKWRAIFGLPGIGRITVEHVLEQVHADDRNQVREAIEEAAQGGQTFSLEHRVVHQNGGVRWVASYGCASFSDNGKSLGLRGASRDITVRRQAFLDANQRREELAHLSRVVMLGELSGSLAHEINQPLGIILSNAQAAQHLLNQDQPDIAELREILADIISEDRRAGEVITRLRVLLRRGEVTLQPVNVNECIEEVLRLVRSDLVDRGVEVSRNLRTGLPSVVSDRVQLQQVLLNLVRNACDAMESNAPRDRRLLLTSKLLGDEVRILVLDRGAGLPEDVETLFKPFYTTKAHGLGMGLAISRALISAHGGRLWAEPDETRGAAFHIALTVSKVAP